jgi:hypothetical protein
MMPKKYPLVQKQAVRLELSRAVEEYNAELKKSTENQLKKSTEDFLNRPPERTRSL